MLAFKHTRTIPVQGVADVGVVRRALVALAADLGFDEGDQGRVALVATELTTNLVRHAGGGRVHATPLDEAVAGLEIAAVDRGPGMDLARCLEDGYSTAGTAGTGLGAIRRQADAFDAVTGSDGSVVVVRLFARRQPPAERPPAAGLVTPLEGEIACGDDIAVVRRDGAICVLAVDGLGHGTTAAEAAVAAVATFRRLATADPVALMGEIHAVLRRTRGAAGAVCRIDPVRRRAVFCGVGNISGCIVAGGERRCMVSHNGILGNLSPRFQAFEYPLPDRALVVLHSDGVATHWQLPPERGLWARDPACTAALLLRDHRRPRDDASVVVVAT